MNVLLWMSGSFDRRTPSEHLLAAIIAALCKQGHVVHVLQKDTGGEKDPLPREVMELGATTTRVKCRLPKHNNLIARYMADIFYVHRCYKWLRKSESYDRIFMQSSNVAGLQARLLKDAQRDVPIVFNVQDIFPENALYSGKFKKKSAAYKCLAGLQRYAYHAASSIITISEDMKEQLVEIGVSKEKIEVVYNWSYQDSQYFSDEIDYGCVDRFMDRSKFNVVYAGNLGLMQNVETIVQAAARMKNDERICFHIIGNGAYRKNLEDLATELRADNVYFHDMLAAEHAPSIYCAADVNVIPLKKDIYRTALPSKTATCLACGKPIVFAVGKQSKFGQEMMRQTGCPLVDSDDAVGLCEAILSIKNGETVCDTHETFLGSFLKTENSLNYVYVLENVSQMQ